MIELYLTRNNNETSEAYGKKHNVPDPMCIQRR